MHQWKTYLWSMVTFCTLPHMPTHLRRLKRVLGWTTTLEGSVSNGDTGSYSHDSAKKLPWNAIASKTNLDTQIAAEKLVLAAPGRSDAKSRINMVSHLSNILRISMY
jgi:hypothetical protein